MRLFKKVDLKDGTPVQFVGVYVLRWQREWGEPQCGFVEVDPDTIEIEEVPDND